MKYYPKKAVWEMTLKCNMNCMHCGSKAGKERDLELTTDECLDIAQQLIDMGLEEITLIGGEIFLKKDWDKVSRKFVDNGVSTNIITNAFNLNEENFEQIKNSGINILYISVDGLENTHNTIRRNPHSFEHVLKVIKRLKEEKMPLGIVTTVTGLNVDELEDMYDFVVDNGIPCWQLQIASPMGNARDNPELVLAVDKVPYLTKFIRDKKALGKVIMFTGDDIGYYDENEDYIRGYGNELWCGCQAGKFVVGIDSIGNVKGCESLQDDSFIEGNLRENTLDEIWNREGAFAYNRNFLPDMLKGKCKDCDKGFICAGGCRQLSYFSTDDKYENIYCCYR
ncbi:MAG: radical SAM protein [Clostridia bacterium]|nr:radical SAM protein [Clostridia bacterium]